MLEVPMLEVSGLRAGYGATEVLRGLDLTVGAGEIVAVLGANGVGKTTLNKVLSAVLRPTAGVIRFDGAPLPASPAAVVAAGLIHVPEGRKIFPDMTVAENLVLGSYRRARAGRARNLDRVYDTFPASANAWRSAPGRSRAGSSRCSRSAAAHGGAAPAHPRRTLPRPVARCWWRRCSPSSAASTRRASRSCWWNRTSCSRWKSRRARRCWRTAPPPCPAPPPTSRERRAAARYLGM
jgi:ABC-type sugar transport system ATPase subunit